MRACMRISLRPCTQAWLSGAEGSHLISALTTSSIVYSLPSFSRLMRSSFPIVFALEAIRRG